MQPPHHKQACQGGFDEQMLGAAAVDIRVGLGGGAVNWAHYWKQGTKAVCRSTTSSCSSACISFPNNCVTPRGVQTDREPLS